MWRTVGALSQAAQTTIAAVMDMGILCLKSFWNLTVIVVSFTRRKPWYSQLRCVVEKWRREIQTPLWVGLSSLELSSHSEDRQGFDNVSGETSVFDGPNVAIPGVVGHGEEPWAVIIEGKAAQRFYRRSCQVHQTSDVDTLWMIRVLNLLVDGPITTIA